MGSLINASDARLLSCVLGAEESARRFGLVRRLVHSVRCSRLKTFSCPTITTKVASTHGSRLQVYG